MDVAKLEFPLPPLPPLHKITGSSPDKSAIILPVLASLTTVPLGIFIIKSLAALPEHFFAPPFSPLSATYFLLYLKSISVEKLSSTKKTISPPFPPSPPSGPPALTYFSR